MHIVRIEHPVKDVDAWKTAFDSDPAGRQASGVRAYRVMRDLHEPGLVLIDLEFDAAEPAERFLTMMRGIWQGDRATAVLADSPQARVVELVELTTYDAPAG